MPAIHMATPTAFAMIPVRKPIVSCFFIYKSQVLMSFMAW